MKFKATIESATHSYDVEFDLDDQATAQARLADVLGDISKRFLRKGERAEKQGRAMKSGPASPTMAGGGAK
ncbi:MAG: hypothetical protein WB973_17090 [Thermoanaerobaculia bacterium]